MLLSLFAFFVLFVCLSTNYASGNEDLVGVRVDTPRAVSKVDRLGLLIVKPNVTLTVRLFGTRLFQLAAVYVTTSKHDCAPEHYVHPHIRAESFEETSPHTIAFPFRFPWPKRQYYFCFEWKNERRAGGRVPHHHQGFNRYQHIETRSPARIPIGALG